MKIKPLNIVEGSRSKSIELLSSFITTQNDRCEHLPHLYDL
jgi:hypothetical protein